MLDSSWCFGPQGHPASMRVVVGLCEEDEKTVLYLWKIGPLCATDYEMDDHFSFDRLHSLLSLGEAINKAFPTRPDWQEFPEEEAKAARRFFAEKSDVKIHKYYSYDWWSHADWESSDD